MASRTRARRVVRSFDNPVSDASCGSISCKVPFALLILERLEKISESTYSARVYTIPQFANRHNLFAVSYMRLATEVDAWKELAVYDLLSCSSRIDSLYREPAGTECAQAPRQSRAGTGRDGQRIIPSGEVLKLDAQKQSVASADTRNAGLSDPQLRFSSLRPLLFGLGVVVALAWAYWPVLREMARKWSDDPQYSHAYLVPVFALYLVFQRRRLSNETNLQPTWWGLPLLVAGVGLRLAGAYFFIDWVEAASLLPTLAGATLLLAGRSGLRQSWPGIAFLFFMIPLPYAAETALSQPMQRMATTVSTYFLQTLGRPALSEGNIIIINDSQIGVVEACNGLGMMLLFFALAVAVAIVVRRSFLEKAFIVASAAPIAVVVNAIRITVGGLLYELVASPWLDKAFHDYLAAWLMMGLALTFLWLELLALSHLFMTVGSASKRLQMQKPIVSQASVPRRKPPVSTVRR